MLEKLKSPEIVKPSKPKFMLSGDPGVGKTFFALSFLKPVFVDIESGGTREQYQKKLKESGGVYFGRDDGANDFAEVIKLVKGLTTEKHEYKTLILDSVSHLYLTEAAIAEETIGNDFGKDKKAANKPTRQLLRWLENLDMTVILIAHAKQAWERKGSEVINVGTTFDFYEKASFSLDLWCEILKGGKNFVVRKSRIESLPQGSTFPLAYEKFAELYGREVMESSSVPVGMATEAQVKRIKELITALNVPAEQIQKWYKKVNAEEWEDMTSIQITSLTDMLNKKILELNLNNGKDIK